MNRVKESAKFDVYDIDEDDEGFVRLRVNTNIPYKSAEQAATDSIKLEKTWKQTSELASALQSLLNLSEAVHSFGLSKDVPPLMMTRLNDIKTKARILLQSLE